MERMYTVVTLVPADYEAVSGVFTFSPMVQRIGVNVTIINDEIVENDETFSAVLDAQGMPVDVSPDTATITIIEDTTDSEC